MSETDKLQLAMEALDQIAGMVCRQGDEIPCRNAMQEIAGAALEDIRDCDQPPSDKIVRQPFIPGLMRFTGEN